jgi:hypothetical protein
LERGHGKSTREGNSLVAYSTASPVLNGGDEETGIVRPRLVATQLECGFNRGSQMRLPCKAGELPCEVALANASHSVARVSPQQGHALKP